MTTRRFWYSWSVGLVTLLSGCVERKMTIISEPSAATVYVNGKKIGKTPVDHPFLYYGVYHIVLERDGYKSKSIQEPISAPVYAYPPIDFLTEHLYPFTIRDFRRLEYELEPLPRPNLDELRQQAEELRREGQNLPDPTRPPRKEKKDPQPKEIPGPKEALIPKDELPKKE